MTVTVMGAKEARNKWRDVLDAAHDGADTIIERNGKGVAAIISFTDYQDILEELEDRRADRRAIAAYEDYKRDSSGAVPYREFRAELVAEGLLDA